MQQEKNVKYSCHLCGGIDEVAPLDCDNCFVDNLGNRRSKAGTYWLGAILSLLITISILATGKPSDPVFFKPNQIYGYSYWRILIGCSIISGIMFYKIYSYKKGIRLRREAVKQKKSVTNVT
jgi:hypothetical protein